MKPRSLTLRAWHYSVAAVMFLAASLIDPSRGVGQTRQYVVTELSSGVPCKLNTLGDIAGRGASEGVSRATIWNRSNFKSKGLSALVSGDYSSASDINDLGDVA